MKIWKLKKLRVIGVCHGIIICCMLVMLLMWVVLCMSQMYSGGRLGQRDFFAVELCDALPYLVVDFGDRVHRFNFTRTSSDYISDGSAHHVKVERSHKTLTLSLDDHQQSVNIISSFTSLDLGNNQQQFNTAFNDQPRVFVYYCTE